jgi:hypothetical protein
MLAKITSASMPSLFLGSFFIPKSDNAYRFKIVDKILAKIALVLCS